MQGADGHGSGTPFRAWWTLGIFFLAAVLSYTDRQILTLVVDPIRTTFAVSDMQIALLQGTAFAIFYALFGLPMGMVSDRYSRRNIILAGVVVWSLATLGCAFAGSFSTLFMARLLVGAGEAVLMPAALSILGDMFPSHRRGTAVGIFVAGIVAGAGIALIFGGALLELVGDQSSILAQMLPQLPEWRLLFLLAALPGVPMALLLLTVREPVRTTSAAARPGAANLVGLLREIFRRHSILLPMYVGLAALALGDYALIAWAPTYLMRVFELTPGMVGAWSGMVMITAGLLGTTGAGILSDRFVLGSVRGRLRLAVFASMVAAFGSLIGFAGSAGWALCLMGLWIVASYAAATIAFTTIQDHLPGDMRGTGTAIVAIFNTTLGLAGGPVLVAAVAQYLERDSIGIAISAVMLPAAGIGILAMFRAWSNQRLLVGVPGSS